MESKSNLRSDTREKIRERNRKLANEWFRTLPRLNEAGQRTALAEKLSKKYGVTVVHFYRIIKSQTNQ